MWGMTAMAKGTAMKDKKKRTAVSTGTYPDGFVVGGITYQLGVRSPDTASGSAPSPNLHASVTCRDSIVLPAGGGQAFLQIVNAAGQNLNSQGAPEFAIGDYVATALRGETPVALTTAQGNAEPGVIYVPNIIGNNAHTRLIWLTRALANGSSAWNGGTATVSAVVNAGSIPLSGTLTDSMSGNPPTQGSYLTTDFDTTGLSNQTEVILEFRITGQGKAAGTQTTKQASASDISNGSALKVGSCYVKIIWV